MGKPNTPEVQALREATRQAHETIQDLKALIKEGHGLVAEIKAAAKIQVEEQVEPIIKEEIRKLGEATTKAIDSAVEKVGHEFQKLEDLYFGRDKRSVRRGRRTLPEMLQQLNELD